MPSLYSSTATTASQRALTILDEVTLSRQPKCNTVLTMVSSLTPGYPWIHWTRAAHCCTGHITGLSYSSWLWSWIFCPSQTSHSHSLPLRTHGSKSPGKSHNKIIGKRRWVFFLHVLPLGILKNLQEQQAKKEAPIANCIKACFFSVILCFTIFQRAHTGITFWWFTLLLELQSPQNSCCRRWPSLLSSFLVGLCSLASWKVCATY